MRDLLAFCESEHAWAIETTRALVELESPSTDKAAADACGRELETRLTALGGRVQRLPRETAGDHVLAEFGCGDRQVLLLGHYDTVWPVGELARQPWREEDGRLFGPGVYDMKAGLALAMLAVRALQQSPDGLPGRVTFLVTSDEETGSETSRSIIEDEARRSAAVLVLEPSLPAGALKTSRKGCGQYTVGVQGIAAHAGVEPEKGASAVHELARLVSLVASWQDAARGLTINVGTLTGGTRPNVVAESAQAEVDVRVATLGDAERIDALMRALRPADARVSLEITGGFDRPPLERTEGVATLFGQAKAVAAELGRALGEGGTGGGSDGNLTAAAGVPTLDGLGAVGGGAHAVGEYVDASELPWRAALVAGLLRRILAS